jgi:acetyltransferase-like isoleucine patch superfamily enzyme
LERLYKAVNKFYIRRFVAPQFDSLGEYIQIVNPRHIEIFGDNIHLGKCAQIICASDNKVRITTWPDKHKSSEIIIGDHCLISPGVRISAAQSIRLGDNVMLAANVTISDSDWHGTYNRVRPFNCHKPVILENNVWLGERAIINKGVTIGENSIIGAGAVVTHDIPANCIAAGNPARVVKTLNPKRRMLTRAWIFKNPDKYLHHQDQMDRYNLGNNGWINWGRSIVKPTSHD